MQIRQLGGTSVAKNEAYLDNVASSAPALGWLEIELYGVLYRTRYQPDHKRVLLQAPVVRKYCNELQEEQKVTDSPHSQDQELPTLCLVMNYVCITLTPLSFAN